MGCWLGHTSFLMAKASKTTRVYACDNFKWQMWMNNFHDATQPVQFNESFELKFRKNTQTLINAKRIIPIEWCNDTIVHLPNQIEHMKFDIVYFDFTRDSDELDKCWMMLKKCFIPNKTLIILNSLCFDLIKFLNKHNNELELCYKPLKSKCKVFKFKSNTIESQILRQPKFKFLKTDEWSHLHNDAYAQATTLLKTHIHCNKSKIYFVTSVEVAMCDFKQILRDNKWIGIIHSSLEHDEHYYVPDLKSLCSDERYDDYMRNCLGLFTLTTHQAEYLRENLKFKIPITRLFYPFVMPTIDLTYFPFIPLVAKTNLVFIGSYARDYRYFIEIETSLREVCLGPNLIEKQRLETFNQTCCHDNRKILILAERLNDLDYERMLHESIIFLSIKYEGAANTILLECIARNVPILVPSIQSCLDYVGHEYPLLYTPGQINFDQLTNVANLEKCVTYLQNMDKSVFSLKQFCNDVKTSLVFKSIAPISNQFYVTICICSYKRTHHLANILDRLWTKQTKTFNIQIIVWNNNNSRRNLVASICEKYIRMSSSTKSLELINSTQNYFCMIRLALTHLMQSDKLLICDDDIEPGERFVEFFCQANKLYPNDVLCSRGHVFRPHRLNQQRPEETWCDYENLKFVADEAKEQTIHFVHADTCLIPKNCLLECNSVELFDQEFKLVDDYWMSYVLSHRFHRNLRKLQVKQELNVFKRSFDSDQVGLALHTQTKVKDARNRLYIHHMLNGWPKFECDNLSLKVGYF